MTDYLDSYVQAVERAKTPAERFKSELARLAEVERQWQARRQLVDSLVNEWRKSTL